jgi:nucleoside 2-deoxyribosyltransferase
MNRVFITASFKNGENREEIGQLCSVVREAGFDDFCFIRDVENYQKVFNDPQELMRRTTEEIQKSDFLLIDLTEKPTGRAVEAGIAYALDKGVIVIAQKGTQIKDTTRGIASAVIEYERIEGIIPELRKLLT